MADELPILTRGSENATRCKHYNGTYGNEVCEAGVAYASVRIEGEWKYRYKGSKTVYTHGVCYPCLGKWNLGGATCDKREVPTAEEAAAEEREMQKRFSDTITARLAIVVATDGKRGVAGKIDCPVCNNGKLHYSVSGYNGHIHAKCSTENCVAWME
jgi:hypothetical protein